ncbi:MAG: hypothetical protein ACREEQ_00845, partial [Caulobacteraceae bacterium]
MPRAAGNSRSNARPSPAVAYLAALLLFAGHLALGADRTNLALGLAAAWFVFLAVLVASRPWARRALERAPLALVAVAFATVFL